MFYKNMNLENSNQEFINNLLSSSNAYFQEENKQNNLISKFINSINNIELKEPITIIDKVFAYEEPIVNTQNFFYAQNIVVDNPRVYIYSTHSNEGYIGEKIEGYDMDVGVVLASILLQEKLNEKGIMTIVEERNTYTYAKENNLDDTYQASRIFLKEALEKNDFDLIIDLHRDAVSKTITTTTIDNRNYAKVMLVMNKNFPNVSFAKKLNDIIDDKYPTLSRGLYYKYYDNFNQDLSPNAVLMELGGNYNTFDEVKNSIDALANSIEELLNEKS